MPRTTLGRRLLTGLAAAAVACVVASPASAAQAATVTIVLPPATVPAGGNTYVSPILYASSEVVLENAKVTYEISDGLTGVTLHDNTEVGPDCTEVSPTKLTCDAYDSLYVGPDGLVGPFTVQIDAAKAALGQSGKLTTTFSADGVEASSQTTDVTVAEAVDLAAGDDKEISLKPGANFNASLQVHNTTDAVVHGAALIFGTDFGFAATKQFSNCFYDGDELNACQFDQELEPGVTYQVVLPYQLRPTTAAPSGQAGEFEWLTAGDYEDVLKFLDDAGYGGPGQAGNGGKLTLKALPPAKSLAKQTDTNPDNNWQSLFINVTGKQSTDIAAIGASLKGKAGDKVTANVGMRNNGPATVDHSRSGSPASLVMVTIPDGTKVVQAPDACFLAEGDYVFLKTPRGKGKVQYGCLTDFVFPAKTTVSFPFQLEITKVADNATGWVEANPACECDTFSQDINKSNDVAKIVVNPVAAPGNGAGEGDTGGEGGGLPITGPQTALFGAAGLILVAAGVGGVLFARRRRTRFEV